MTIHFALYFLSLLVLASSSCSDDLRCLLEFKKGIKNDPMGKVTGSWGQNSVTDFEPCPKGWTGVSCEGGSVTSIVLDRLGLSGELKFTTLIGLKSLEKLSLVGNFFTGRLAPALGTVKSLRHLDLSGNRFYGPVPARIHELGELQYLNLSGNQFRGGFPSGINNLWQLKVLDLRGNEIWGDVGDLMAELGSVEHVDLSSNQFFGQLPGRPENFSGLVNTLKHLNLSRNGLSSGFFSSEVIGSFKNLEVVDLGDNQINGELPSFGSLFSLRVMRLRNNQLYGAVPVELLEGSMSVEELDLSGNGFTGSIRDINSMTLNVLNLSSNGLSGTLPASLSRCSVLDLSRNTISGDISVMQNWNASFEVLDLSSNSLSGKLPNLTSIYENLRMLNLQNNSLEGDLPSMLVTSQRMSVIDISANRLGGPIHRSFFTSPTLSSVNLSGNNFSGSIPLQGAHASALLLVHPLPILKFLDLSSNSFTGTLPSEIGNFEGIRLLNAAKNDLSGELPVELSKLSNLESLDLSGNKFNGRIPDNLPMSIRALNVSGNDLSGTIPENLRKFPTSSFKPGNSLLMVPIGTSLPNSNGHDQSEHHGSKDGSKVAIIISSVVAAVMVLFALLTYHRAHLKDFHGRTGQTTQTTGRDVKSGRFARPSLFNFQSGTEPPPTSLSFSNDHLLTSNSRSLSGKTEFATETSGHASLPEGVVASSVATIPNLLDDYPATSGRKSSGSPVSSSPRFIEAREKPVMLDVYSPDRLAGELSFLDASLTFTGEELSRAPAEVLGRSSHGTLYKATLDSGHMLTVKWLRVGLVKNKKEFAKEVKRIGAIRHPNIVPLRAYYWGPREQERLLLADYIPGDSLSLHLYESTPRRYSTLSFSQRLKVAADVARSLLYLHDRSLPHGNLKPTNILLTGSDYSACLTDYGLHRLMTPPGIAEQILNFGALGYRAPELASAAKPSPSLKADVYALGVILMELLTRRSAGDIISGQSSAVDLTDWVRLCDQEGRGRDCIDRDIASGEEPPKAMDDLLAISLRCILPVNERPNIRQVFEDLSSLSI